MPARRGFSLIELLVVISVISLMISILLPALSHARARARAVLCLSNERQIGLGMHLYAADYNDRLPPFSEGKPGQFQMSGGGTSSDARRGGGKLWYEMINETAGGTLSGRNPLVTNFVDFSQGVWQCPEVTPDQMMPGSTITAWGGGYAANINLMLYGSGTGPSTGRMPELSEIRRPAQLLLIGEGGRPRGNGTATYTTWGMLRGAGVRMDLMKTGSNSEQPATRHLDRTTHVTFVDGHAATTSFEDLQVDAHDMFALQSY